MKFLTATPPLVSLVSKSSKYNRSLLRSSAFASLVLAGSLVAGTVSAANYTVTATNVTANSPAGVDADSTGVDAATVNGTGDAIVSTGTGIDIESNTGTISITTTNDVTGGTTGSDRGINTTTVSGQTDITLGGNVTGYIGIYHYTSNTFSTGNITIGGTGTISGTGDTGMTIFGSAGANSITQSGNISAKNAGIFVQGRNAGTVSITGSGDIIGGNAGALQNGIQASFGGTGGNITINRANGNIIGGDNGIHASAAGSSGSGSVEITANQIIEGKAATGVTAYAREGNITVTAVAAGTIKGQTYGVNTDSYGGGDITVNNAGQVTGTTSRGVNARAKAGMVLVDNSGTISGGTDGVWAETTTGVIHVINSGTLNASGDGGRAINAKMSSTSASANGITISNTGTINNDSLGAGNGSYARGILAERHGAGSGTISITSADISLTNTGNLNVAAVHANQVSASSAGLLSIDTRTGTLTVIGSTAAEGVIGINASISGSGGLDIKTGAINITGGLTPSIPSTQYGGIAILASSVLSGSAMTIATSGALTGGRYGIRAMSVTNNGDIDITTNGTISAAEKGIDASNGYEFNGALKTGVANLTADIHVTTNAAIGTGAGNPQYGIVARGGNGTIEIDANAAITSSLTGIYTQSEGNGTVDIDSTGQTVIGASEGIKVAIHNAGQIDIVTGITTGTSVIAIDVDAGTGAKNITTNDVTTGGTYGISAVNSSGTGTVKIDAKAAVSGGTQSGIAAQTGTGDIVVGLDVGSSAVSGAGNVSGVTGGIWTQSDSGAITIGGTGTSSASGAGSNAIRARMAGTGNAGTSAVTINRTGLITMTGTGSTRAVTAVKQTSGSGNISVTVGNLNESNGGNSFGVDVYMEHQSSTGQVIINTTAGTIDMDGSGATKGIYAASDGQGKVDVDAGAIDIASNTGTGIHAVTSFSSGTNDAAIEIDTTGAITGGAIGILAEVSNSTGANANITIITGAAVGIGGSGAAQAVGIKTTAKAGATLITLGGAVASDGDGIQATSTTGNVSVAGTGAITGGTAAGEDGIDITTTSGNAIVTLSGAITGDPGVVISSTAGGNLEVSGTGMIEGTAAEGVSLTSAGGNGNVTVNQDGNILGKTDGVAVSTSGASGTGVATVTVQAGHTMTGTDGRGIYATTVDGAIDLNIDGSVSGGTHGIEFSSTGGDITLDIKAGGSVGGSTNAILGSTTSGTFTFNNAGTLQGLLNITGTDAASLFTNSGTWNAFGGRSGLSGKLTNTGTLNLQGNGVADTFAVSGDLTFGGSSVLKIDVDKTGASDRITADGAVVLGGTLDLLALGVSADYPIGNSFEYELIDKTSSGLATGAFSTITTNFAFLSPSIDLAGDDGNDVFLKLTASDPAPDFKPHASNANQDGAALSMDNFDYSTTSGTAVYNAVIGLTNPQAEDAINKISGNDHQAAAGLGSIISYAFHSLSMNRSGLGTGGRNDGGSALGYAASDSDDAGVSAIEAATGDAEISSEFWARTFAAHSSVDKGTTLADISANSAGVAFGVEFADLATDFVLGVSAGYTAADFSTQAAGSSSKSDNYHVGLYGFWGATGATETGWGVAGAVDYTAHEYATRRALIIGGFNEIAAANYSGHTVGGEIKVRYGMGDDGADSSFLWAPIAGLSLSRSSNDGYAETGAGSLNITAGDTVANHASSLFGVEFSNQNLMGETPVTMTFSAGWRHEFADTKQSSTYTLQGSPTSFTTSSPEEARDRLVLQAGASFATSANSAWVLSGQGEVSKTSVQYGADVSFRVKF